MPESSLRILKTIYEYKLSDIGLNFSKISTVRFWDSPEGFNNILELYYDKCSKIINEKLKIEEKNRCTSFSILLKEAEDKTMKNSIISCKKTINHSKKECVAKLFQLKVKTKLIPTINEIMSSEEAFSAYKNLDTCDKMLAYCNERKIDFDSLFDENLLEYIKKYILFSFCFIHYKLTISRTNKVKLNPNQKLELSKRLAKLLIHDPQSAIRKIGESIRLVNSHQDSTTHCITNNANFNSDEIANHISMILIDCRLSVCDSSVIEKLSHVHKNSSIVIFHKKEFSHELNFFRSFKYKTLLYLQVKPFNVRNFLLLNVD